MAKSAPALKVLWPDSRLVGKVVVPGPTYFGYHEAWLADGYNLSPLVIPFTPIVFRQREEGFDRLPGFLSDCLPDQWGRRIMERQFRELDVTPTAMHMLAWVGNRGLGALSFAPALDGIHSPTTWERVTPLLLTREAQAVARNSGSETFRRLREGGTAGGAYPKATVGLMRDGTLVTGGNLSPADIPGIKLGILKLDVEDEPLRPSTDGRIEAAYLLMARAAGIRAASAQVLTDEASTRPRHHIFVERFDVDPNGRRMHMISLAGLLHRHDLTYVDLLTATRDLTGDHAEVLEAVRRMCFNVRSGNADDHGKNHSFIFDPVSGKWRLSPAYDLTPSHSRDHEMRGLFPNTFGGAPRRQALADVAAEVGVTAAQFEKIDRGIKAVVDRWPEHAERLKLPESLAAHAAGIQRELNGGLTKELPKDGASRRPRW